jgi:plasmid maintenance system antidote protein VapI
MKVISIYRPLTGAQLQKLLDRAGMSQRGAARAMGIDERTMRRYVAGDAEIPRVVELAMRCLAEHFQR